MLILNAEQVRRAFPMEVAVETMKAALLSISLKQVDMPNRVHLDLEKHNGTTLIMPAYAASESIESLSVKVVSVFDNNPQKKLPRIQAAVMAFDPETGQPTALIEGATVTGIRTAAASGAATDVLARQDCKSVAIVGAGVQAHSHLDAMMSVRPIERVFLAARNRDVREKFVTDKMANPVYSNIEFIICDADEAVSSADIVCTVTTAATPVFGPESVRRGTHINAVGSYKPHVAEIPPETVAASRVFVDHLESALEEAGDLLQPIESKLIDKDHIVGEVGQVIAEQVEGRKSGDEITLFKSVGNAAEDCFSANRIVARAIEMGLGQQIDW